METGIVLHRKVTLLPAAKSSRKLPDDCVGETRICPPVGDAQRPHVDQVGRRPGRGFGLGHYMARRRRSYGLPNRCCGCPPRAATDPRCPCPRITSRRGAADHDIVAVPVLKEIVAGTPEQDVVAQPVVDHRVVAAVQNIAAVPAVKPIDAAAGERHLFRRTGDQSVFAGAAGHRWSAPPPRRRPGRTPALPAPTSHWPPTTKRDPAAAAGCRVLVGERNPQRLESSRASPTRAVRPSAKLAEVVASRRGPPRSAWPVTGVPERSMTGQPGLGEGEEFVGVGGAVAVAVLARGRKACHFGVGAKGGCQAVRLPAAIVPVRSSVHASASPARPPVPRRRCDRHHRFADPAGRRAAALNRGSVAPSRPVAQRQGIVGAGDGEPGTAQEPVGAAKKKKTDNKKGINNSDRRECRCWETRAHPAPRLVAYVTGEAGAASSGARRRPRAWMDATPHSFAYRCLPLTVANSHGWEILNAERALRHRRDRGGRPMASP